MPGKEAEELLQAWEDGLDSSPARRALTLLTLEAPQRAEQELAELPIGVRDVGLLRLRQRLFGDEVNAVCSCPACAEQLDVSFALPDLLPSDLAPLGDGLPEEHARVLSLAEYDVTVRAPNSADLMAVMGETDAAASARALVRRLVLEVTPTAESVAEPDGLPDQVADALSAELASLDPYARIELQLACSACGHSWPTVFDVAPFLWAEVNAWARHLLSDVHTLAQAYGWRERDILAMSPLRRQGYLELVGG